MDRQNKLRDKEPHDDEYDNVYIERVSEDGSVYEVKVEKVCIWTPDKDLAQCVSGSRVVQVDRRSNVIRDEAGVHAKFGVAPTHIPDYLALVGDAADGYPGIPRIGAKTAAQLIARPLIQPDR